MNNPVYRTLVVVIILAILIPVGDINPSRGSSSKGDNTPIISNSVLSVSAGGRHTCAVTEVGGVKCWGDNSSGQLGDGTNTYRNTPVDVVGLASGVNAVAGGHIQTCALTGGGGVKCWGDNSFGQLGDGTNVDRSMPVDVLGLSSGITAVASGGNHSCALTSSGDVKCWGSNNYGQLGDGTNVDRSTPVEVVGIESTVIGIVGGGLHTCALTSAGGVKCWGSNYYGQLGDGSNDGSWNPVDVVGLSSGIIKVNGRVNHTCALTSIGGVKCWGSNYSGKLGDGTNVDRSIPVSVVGLGSGVIAAAVGRYHTCALTGSNSVKCWGDNFYGQLGDSTNNEHWTPVDVVGLASGVNFITTGGHHSCAITSSAGVKCWGRNIEGQLGDGTNTNRHTPVNVVGLGGGGGGQNFVYMPITNKNYIYYPPVNARTHTTGADGRFDVPLTGGGTASFRLVDLLEQPVSDVPVISIENKYGVTLIVNGTEQGYYPRIFSPVINPLSQEMPAPFRYTSIEDVSMVPYGESKQYATDEELIEEQMLSLPNKMKEFEVKAFVVDYICEKIAYKDAEALAILSPFNIGRGDFPLTINRSSSTSSIILHILAEIMIRDSLYEKCINLLRDIAPEEWLLIEGRNMMFILKNPNVESTTGVIIGQVVDATQSVGMEGATVTLDDNLYKVTLPNGWYRMAGVEEGEHNLKADRYGFTSDNTTVSVAPNLGVQAPTMKINPIDYGTWQIDNDTNGKLIIWITDIGMSWFDSGLHSWILPPGTYSYTAWTPLCIGTLEDSVTIDSSYIYYTRFFCGPPTGESYQLSSISEAP